MLLRVYYIIWLFELAFFSNLTIYLDWIRRHEIRS